MTKKIYLSLVSAFIQVDQKLETKMRYLIPLIFLSLSACASQLKSYDPSKITGKDGALIGRMRVIYNGIDFTDRCSFTLDSDLDGGYELDASGLIAMKVESGPHKLRRISCSDVSMQHFVVPGGKFNLAPNTQTYIGDILVDWKNKGGFKISTIFGLIGAVIDLSSDDGEAKMTLVNRRAETLKDLELEVKTKSNLGVRDSLVQLR